MECVELQLYALLLFVYTSLVSSVGDMRVSVKEVRSWIVGRKIDGVQKCK